MTRISPHIIDTYQTSTVVEDLSPVNVGAAEVSITFSSRRKSCLIYNDGANNVHFSLSTGVTANNFMIPSKWSLSIVFPVTSLYFICAAGQTATLYVIGER